MDNLFEIESQRRRDCGTRTTRRLCAFPDLDLVTRRIKSRDGI
jgi:hypothetical protein